jgi:hypothetical protein
MVSELQESFSKWLFQKDDAKLAKKYGDQSC